MEYFGHTQASVYETSKPQNFASMNPSKSLTDFFPSSAPLRRSYTTLAWRPSVYYQTGRVQNNNVNYTNSTAAPNSVRSNLTELEGLKVPNMFSSARNALYTRYTPNDWMKAAEVNYNVSDNVRNNAEKIRQDTTRLAREFDDRTKRAQEDSGKKLGDRVADINYLKVELNDEVDKMVTESEALSNAKRVAEKYLTETENPLHVTQECLYNREKRAGIDLVHDMVEKSLLGEVDLIKKCQDQIAEIINKANVQLNLNRAAQHEMEKDSHDKFQAEQIDTYAQNLKNSSPGIAYYNGVENIDNCISTPETWLKFTSNNLQRSVAERDASRRLREEIELALARCQRDMAKQWAEVNANLSQRAQETADARNKIQNHLNKVLQEIFDMEKNINYIKKSILDKEAPLKVAQTRLHVRLDRPNMEACRDPPRSRLIEEVHEIRETINDLNRQLHQAEATMHHLLSSKSSLEHDLNVKTNSLFIDRERCLGARKTFPMPIPVM